MRIKICFLSSLLAISGIAFDDSSSYAELGQEEVKEPSKNTKRLLDSVSVAPVEIKADLLFVLLSRQAIPPVLSLALLTDLFFEAKQAAAHFPVAGAVAGTIWIGDSDAAIQIAASRRKLDRLSIQCRAVQSILPLDPRRAINLFDSIEVKISPQSCRSAVWIDLTIYYRLLSDIFVQGFTTEQRKNGEDIDWLLRRASISSIVQLLPLIKSVQNLPISDGTMDRLTSSLAISLDTLPVDDRSYSAIMKDVVDYFAKTSHLSQNGLQASFLRYAQRSATTQRCAENAGAKIRDEELQILRRLVPVDERVSIELPNNVYPSSNAGKADLFNFWSDDAGGALMNQFKQLKYGPLEGVSQSANSQDFGKPSNSLLPLEARRSIAWREACTKLLISIDEWAIESKVARPHRFAILMDLYENILEIIPSTDHVTAYKTLQTSVKLLADESYRREFPSLWLLKWREIYGYFAESKRLPELQNAVRTAGDPVMMALIETTGDALVSKN